jgi:hypothetical protein
MGGGAVMLVGAVLGLDEALQSVARTTFAVALVVDLLMLLLGEFGIPHASEIAARAAHEIKSGRFRNRFWWGVVAAGHVLPFALLLSPAPLAAAAAMVVATVGLYLYEHAFVMAPQEVPNS